MCVLYFDILSAFVGSVLGTNRVLYAARYFPYDRSVVSSRLPKGTAKAH